jgi:hypothetical protein
MVQVRANHVTLLGISQSRATPGDRFLPECGVDPDGCFQTSSWSLANGPWQIGRSSSTGGCLVRLERCLEMAEAVEL